MAHVVADPVRAPAQGEFGQVTGAEHERAALVGQTKQIIGAQPRLHVLERDVVVRLAARERMLEVGEHLLRRRPDVDLGRGDAERAHQRPGVGPGRLRGREARQGEAQDVAARQAETVEGARGDEQRVARIEAAGHADHDVLQAGRLQALAQSLHLDVERLEAIAIEPVRIVRNEREAIDRTDEADVGVVWRVPDRDAPECALRVSGRARCRVEGRRAHALGAQALDVDVGDGHLARGGKALGLRERHAQLVDRRLAIPGKIGRALARPGRGVDVRCLAA